MDALYEGTEITEGALHLSSWCRDATKVVMSKNFMYVLNHKVTSTVAVGVARPRMRQWECTGSGTPRYLALYSPASRSNAFVPTS